jgi:glycosyltransferase involved in cell wall biosynthesis
MELSVVLPAHNEAAGIEDVVREVAKVAEMLAGGRAEILVIDDGSSDDTGAILDRLGAELALVHVVHQSPNRGHGPALLRGFDLARGHWIGHLDTDDQIPTAELERLWAVREGAELVLGVRTDRADPRYRLLLSRVVRSLVALLAGGHGVRDANVPCKLIDRELWHEVRPLLDDDTFAPSVALSMVASRWKRTVREVPVAHRPRAHGASSLNPRYLAHAVTLSTRQTLALARRLRSRAPGAGAPKVP